MNETSSTPQDEPETGVESRLVGQNVEETSDPHLAIRRLSKAEYRLETVNPKTLKISEYNVRKRDVQGTTWEEFLEDIRTNGVIDPPIVTPSNQVIAGQRRVIAAKKAGLEEINILRLKEEPTKVEAIAMSLRENHHREALYQDDRLDAIIILRDELGNDKQAIADAIGVKKYTVQAWLSMEAIRHEVPNIVNVGGIEKQLTAKRILSSPAYKDAPAEDKMKLVETLKDKPQAVLRKVLEDAKAGMQVPEEHPVIFTLFIPDSLHSFCFKQFRKSPSSLCNHILFLLKDWAKDQGWKE